MTATIIFWTAMVISILAVGHNTAIRMDYHIRGYQKVKGQWTQTMYPQHYCLEMTFFSFAMMAGCILAVVFFGAVAILDFSGLSERFAIQTIFHFK